MEHVELNTMSGGRKVATDRVTEGADSLEVQVIKLMLGDNGVNGPLLSEDDPLPVQIISQSMTRDFLASGNSLYSTMAGEFIATPTSASKSVVLSTIDERLLTTLALNTFAMAVVKKISSLGVVSDIPVSNVAWNSGSSTVTFADMAANFAVGDTVAMVLIGPDKGLWQRLGGENIDDQLLGVTKKATSSGGYGHDLLRGFDSGSYKIHKPSPGTINSIIVTSKDPAGAFLLLIDRATAPSGGSNVLDSLPISPGSALYPTYLSLDADDLENFYFQNGITLALSSVDMSYTAVTTPANFTMRAWSK